MTVERYAFTDCDATTAAGVPLRIPAGVHQVERRSLVFRVRLGGRELDLTLAEWERLLDAGCVGPVVALLEWASDVAMSVYTAALHKYPDSAMSRRSATDYKAVNPQGARLEAAGQRFRPLTAFALAFKTSGPSAAPPICPRARSLKRCRSGGESVANSSRRRGLP